ncbi:putative ABC transporter [Rosellinia necatrix]|uniref:Putative ABC transporter n=1 Tax=Rosellinia necatrix TaxID=77044 RepID=A0A1W2TUA6_ROSNE|nr:putative ABC transporter [Rosellinia necatrix]
MVRLVTLGCAALSGAGIVSAYDATLGFNGAPEVETRTLDEIYKAAVAEGGVVTVWHGGDEPDQQDGLKQAFEARFPDMTLNVTVDVSKYHDGNVDRQLATGGVYVDSVILQTLHDYPRWDNEGALLHYKPLGFDALQPSFRDPRGAWYGVTIIGWSFIWNTDKVSEGPQEFEDFLKPEFKDKLVLTYPNDDDAVLYAFDLIMQEFGYGWFEKLLAQNPRWVRGSATPVTVLAQANSTSAVTFTSSIGLTPFEPLNLTFPTKGQFVTWPQRAAILKDAPHPEGAKLLHSFLLSEERQQSSGGWSVRQDVAAPEGYQALSSIKSTNPDGFESFMVDRERVERLKLFFEDKLGTPQGLSPLKDDL